jgi:hypothetical protein
MMLYEHCTAQAETRAVKLFLVVCCVCTTDGTHAVVTRRSHSIYDMLGLSAWNVV